MGATHVRDRGEHREPHRAVDIQSDVVAPSSDASVVGTGALLAARFGVGTVIANNVVTISVYPHAPHPIVAAGRERHEDDDAKNDPQTDLRIGGASAARLTTAVTRLRLNWIVCLSGEDG